MLRIPDVFLRRVQALSGLVFVVFLLLHLGNTALAALGRAACDGAQRWLRVVYQAWPVELAVLGALVVHVLVAVLRKLGGRPAPANGYARWHRNAGIFLALFIGGHVFAVRGPSWFPGFHPEFAGVAFSLAYVPAYFYPYYFLLAAAGLYHGLWGFRVAAVRPVEGRERIARVLVHIAGRMAARGGASFGFTYVNGDWGVVVLQDGAVDATMALETRSGAIRRILPVRNPAKLVGVRLDPA